MRSGWFADTLSETHYSVEVNSDLQITLITLASHDEITGISMIDFLRLTEEQPKPVNVENLRYLLKDSFTGKFN